MSSSSSAVALTRQQARRICLRATGLAHPVTGSEPADVARHQFAIKLDFTEAVARSHDLFFFSRLGADVAADCSDRLRGDGTLIELHGRLILADDLALFRAELDTWPNPQMAFHGPASWMAANEGCRRDLLDELRRNGPCTAEELPDSCELPWRSTGWTNNKNVQKLLDLMEACGQVAVVGRRGRARLWDLPERVWPEVTAIGAEQAVRLRAQRKLAAQGLLRPVQGADPVGLAATIEGVRGRWQLDAAAEQWLRDGSLEEPDWQGGTALVSPLDPIVFDRKRLAEVFEFDYQLEMYKPASQRRWGYWALPVLHGDRFVGKVDATVDRDLGRLFVDAIHREDGWGESADWGSGLAEAVAAQLAELARWLGAELEIDAAARSR